MVFPPSSSSPALFGKSVLPVTLVSGTPTFTLCEFDISTYVNCNQETRLTGRAPDSREAGTSAARGGHSHDAVVSAATGVTMRSHGHGGF